MGLTRSPEAELEPHRLGTIATGPWAVGTVVGSVIGGHRGRREATEIPNTTSGIRVGKGLRCTTSEQLKIANPQHSAHSKLQGWSYAVLVHPMGGSHHHIGGSVGSHLPEIQQHIRCPMLMPPADACPWGAASQ
jgi:hypothetical protein